MNKNKSLQLSTHFKGFHQLLARTTTSWTIMTTPDTGMCILLVRKNFNKTKLKGNTLHVYKEDKCWNRQWSVCLLLVQNLKGNIEHNQ